MNIKWNIEQLKTFALNDEITQKRVCEILGISRSSIQNKCRKLKIKWNESRKDRSIYNIDYTFFENDSPELWYFIGFFYADGYISGNRIIGIHLQGSDCDFLLKLIRQFSDAPVRHEVSRIGDKEYPRVSWHSYNRDLYNILRDRFGIVERKSLVIKFPEVPGKYLRDFVRGYFDGDGSVAGDRRRGQGYHFRASMCSGSLKFIEKLKEVLLMNSIKSRFYKMKDKNVYYLYFDVRDSIWSLYMFMYYKDCFCLGRKQKIFNQMEWWEGGIKCLIA